MDLHSSVILDSPELKIITGFVNWRIKKQCGKVIQWNVFRYKSNGLPVDNQQKSHNMRNHHIKCPRFMLEKMWYIYVMEYHSARKRMK